MWHIWQRISIFIDSSFKLRRFKIYPRDKWYGQKIHLRENPDEILKKISTPLGGKSRLKWDATSICHIIKFLVRISNAEKCIVK